MVTHCVMDMQEHQYTPPPTGLCPCPDWLGEMGRRITPMLLLLEVSLSITYNGPIHMVFFQYEKKLFIFIL